MLWLKRPHAESMAERPSPEPEDDDDGSEYEEWGGFSPAELEDADDNNHASDDIASSHDLNTAGAASVKDDAPLTHRYGTRASNKSQRPGIDIGRNWEAEKREREAAQAARAQAKAAAEARKEDRSRQIKRETNGIRKLAELEAQRARADEDDADYIKRGAPPSPSADHSGSEYEDGAAPDDSVDEQDTSAPCAKPAGARKALTAAERRKRNQAAIRGRIDAARMEVDEVCVDADTAAPQQGTAGAEPPFETSAEKGPTGSQSNAFNPAYRNKLLSALTRTSSPMPHATPPSSVSTLRLRLSNMNDSSRTPTPARLFSLSSAQTLVYSPTPSRASTPQVSSRPIVSATAHAMSSCAASTSCATTTTTGHDVFRGLDNADVAMDRSAVTERPTARARDLVEVTEVEEDATAKLKNKTKRTRKIHMDASQSLSADLALPQWLHVVFEGKIVPTLIEHYGSQMDPWNVDAPKEGGPSIIDLVQQLITNLCPRRDYPVDKSSTVIKIARQRMTNWRCGFMSRANTVVKAAHKDFKQRC